VTPFKKGRSGFSRPFSPKEGCLISDYLFRIEACVTWLYCRANPAYAVASLDRHRMH